MADEMHYNPPKPPQRNVLGGAGTYAALGARIVTPTANAKSISWIVDAGNDFPQELRDIIDSWGTSCMIRETSWRQTTRAWNGYDEHENRCTSFHLRLDTNSAMAAND